MTSSRIVVVLMKPTHYDEDGFPYRFLRGVLPSNSLAVMYALTRDALDRILPAHIAREIHVLEDGIERHARQLERLRQRFPEQGTQLIVAMVGVQTAQFPRACDLIDRWQKRGAVCAIGGFHVSGSVATMFDGINDRRRTAIPCPHVMPSELQTLMDNGVVVFAGEAEDLWTEALRDIIAGSPKALYRGGSPTLATAPLPEYPPGYFSGSFVTKIRTFDIGRGCPFLCSFCSVINVHGRLSRCRSPDTILTAVQHLCLKDGKATFFFTDVNFVRSPVWEEILDGLIALRKNGCDVSFMVQADLACHKIPRFLAKLGQAGCSQIFMGVESVNPENLLAVGKRQNNVAEYEHMLRACHDHGIAVHAGYIIGFPADTSASVAHDVETLKALGVDQASFFILTPIPGSEDHARMVATGRVIDPDFNEQDSFHPVFEHPLMTRAEWFAAYGRAWRQFYSIPHMLAALGRCLTRTARFYLLINYFWYRWSVVTEGAHPMLSGFYRIRPYRDRRPGAPYLPYRRYCMSEVWRHMRYVGRFFAEFFRFQYLVFESEYAALPTEVQEKWAGPLRGVTDWFRRTFCVAASRKWLNGFWRTYAGKRWQLLWNPFPHVKAIPFALTEIIYALRFAARLPKFVRMTTA
ncbi:hypothetical protein A3E47_03065 [Candidatus Peribacteria bacterium RIFCSPHIGHO2_12_FULL_54_10]|nr:MAG: hypothetical protein A3E47_03065 [Candidatus Peribacteria bacterium RIFCSPHIGHO2_12_FULL_54_10]